MSRPGEACRRQRGAALIEFALVLPLLLVIAVGIIYYGYVFVLKTATESAARSAVQEAVAVNPLTPGYDRARVLARAGDVAVATLDWLPAGVRSATSVSPEASCDAAGMFGVRVRIDLNNPKSTVLPQFELGRLRVPPRPTVIESYACASI